MARRAHGRRPRRGERPALAPWLVIAAAAHLGTLIALEATEMPAPRVDSRAAAAADPIWLDLIAESATLRAAAPDSAAARRVAGAAAAGDRSAGRRTARLDRAPRASSVAEALGAGAATASGAREGPAESGAPESGAAAPGGSGPQLSLRDLGVGPGSNPFIGSVSELPTERQLLNQRLRQSLRGEIAKQDQARGLGPEGPAVRAVTDIVMASATAPNTTALLRVRTDGAGRVTRADVLEADRDGGEWQRIADELVRALAGKKLRVPAGTDGVSFQLRVVSRVQLPSGADPGLGIDVLGIPLKKGDGERSTKISILSPVIREVEVPDSDGLRVPVVAFSLIGLMGDPVDIGAVARRLVTAYLVAMDTHLPPAGAPPPAAAPAPPAPAGEP